MTRLEFIKILRKKLNGIPKADLEETLDYYNEILSDKIEDGMSEADAINSLGSIDDIVNTTLSEISFPKLIKEKLGLNKKLKTWQIILLASTFYIWIPLSIALFAVLLALYTVLWSGVIVVGAVGASSVACAPVMLIWGIIDIFAGDVASGVLFIGFSFLFLGVALLFGVLTKHFAILMVEVCKKIVIKIKSLFIRRGDLDE